MKQSVTVCLAACLLATLSLPAQQANDMKGAYTLTRQTLNDGTRDSLMQVDQLKIFTDRYMIYAHRMPNDSLAMYGIGTYSFRNGKLVEDVFYTSTDGDRKNSFELDINKTPGGYTQVIHFPPDSAGVHYILTEDYKSSGKAMPSPLDGAWKQTRSSYIPKNGQPVENTSPTQFKVFESGHFIWANTQKDSATQKPVSFFGYGTFEMKGPNEIVEHNTQSSYASQLVGVPVRVKLQFTGRDSYTQTIEWPTGDKTVEVYERLK